MNGKTRPVGQIFADPESTVTLQVTEIVNPQDNNWCRGCHYSRISNNKCRELQNRFLGECLGWKRSDGKKVIFKKI